MSHKNNSSELNVIARGPFQIYYEGKAKGVSGANAVGPFDVLPGHADFFSILEPGEITITTTDKPVTFKANNGIVTVRNDEVMLFVNI